MKPVPSPKVLVIVDDEEDFLASLGAVARARFPHARVETFTDSAEALRFFEKGPADAAVIDIIMPGLDGTQLAERLRSLRPTMPVVLLTTFHDEALSKRLRPLTNVRGFLHKPVNPAELVALLRSLIG